MGKILSVSIGSAGLTAALGGLCQNPSKPVLISKVMFEPYDSGESYEALLHSPVMFQTAMARLIQNNKIKIRKVILTVNSSFFVRELELPIVRDNELEDMVQNEMLQYITPGRGDVVGYTVVDEVIRDSAKLYKIRASVMDGDVIHTLFTGLKGLKLTPEYLDIGINALSKLITGQTKINGQDITQGLTLLADIGYNNTTISLFRLGKLEVQRTLNMGTRTIDAAISDDYRVAAGEAQTLRQRENLFKNVNVSDEEYSALRSSVYGLCDEISKLVQFTGSRLSVKENSSIYIYGAGSSTLGLIEFIGDVLGIPTSRIEELSNVEFTEKSNTPHVADIVNCAGAFIRLQ